MPAAHACHTERPVLAEGGAPGTGRTSTCGHKGPPLSQRSLCPPVRRASNDGRLAHQPTCISGAAGHSVYSWQRWSQTLGLNGANSPVACSLEVEC